MVVVAVGVPPLVELVEFVEHFGQELFVSGLPVNVHGSPSGNRWLGIAPVVISLVVTYVVRNHSVLCLIVEEGSHLIFRHFRIVEYIGRSDLP